MLRRVRNCRFIIIIIIIIISAVESLEIPTETDTQEHAYQKPASDVNELKWHLIETWSATSRASLIKRLISGKIVLLRVLKPNANTEHLLLCFFRNCRDF